MANKWSDEKRRGIASQFFTIFASESPEQMETLLDGQLSKSTIRRDRDGLADGAAPSMKSARVYAAAMQRADGFDTDTPTGIASLVDRVLAARRAFQDAVPRGDVILDETAARFPPFWSRLMRRLDDGQWLSVIDILELHLTPEGLKTGKEEGWAELEFYLRQYLAIAYLREGEADAALTQFQTGLDLVWETNSRQDARYILGLDTAFCLLARRAEGDEDQIVRILKRILGDAPPHAMAVVNAIIVASQLDEAWCGYFTNQLRDTLVHTNQPLDFDLIHSKILSEPELQNFRNHDMYREIEATVRARTTSDTPAPQTGKDRDHGI